MDFNFNIISTTIMIIIINYNIVLILIFYYYAIFYYGVLPGYFNFMLKDIYRWIVIEKLNFRFKFSFPNQAK